MRGLFNIVMRIVSSLIGLLMVCMGGVAGIAETPAVAAGGAPGVITTVVGSTVNYKSYGYSGDGGPATSAQLTFVVAVTVLAAVTRGMT